MVDFKVLDTLAESIGDKEFVVEVVKTFLSNLPGQLNDLQTHFKNGDAKAMGMAAHAITSAAQNVGANDLGKLTKQLDQMGRTGSLNDADKIVAELLKTFGETQVALHKYLSEKASR